MRVELIADDCVGAGQCVLAAPAVFDQDEDGVAIVLDETPGSEEHEAVREAVDLCPSSALRLLRLTAESDGSH
ncbi:ferredoxin [Streptomyces sp. TBY4]|uniref:ferredoxin n=1 Tax=Streptomyces sp. TBY4 TaxID=2962030 RepID=UPI0020B87059|nr:ferredoxin [Streptomyces sp. TBY4]MCP3760680.1 (4Fe-4S)-binding protein [Streptomyces sp. TBY4]